MRKPIPLRWRLWALLGALALLIAVLVTQIRPPADPLPPRLIGRDSAYLWQRQWTPEVLAAVAAPGPVKELRVLALEVDARGQISRPLLDLAALAAGPAAVVPVVRIDGRRPPLAPGKLGAALKTLFDEWRAAGLEPGLVELDHDCARSGLADYTNWLAQLRESWTHGPQLAITGLPDWLASDDLRGLLADVDGFTLQVHAVDGPAAGLFDPARAARWVAQLDERTRRPFDVALPTYSARIGGRLYWAQPEQVAELLAQWKRHPPRNLRTVRFFRLPVAGDGNSWSAATLAAVIAGAEPQPKLTLEQRASASGAVDVIVANGSDFDAPLPQRIVLPATCVGDGASGYGFERSPGNSALKRLEPDRLPPGRRRTLGWIRCPNPVELRLDGP